MLLQVLKEQLLNYEPLLWCHSWSFLVLEDLLGYGTTKLLGRNVYHDMCSAREVFLHL